MSRDGRFALSGSTGRKVKLWELASGRGLRTLKGHTDAVTAVALSIDGCFALSGSRDRTLKLWDLTEERLVRSFEGHSDCVCSVAISADGRFALSGSADRTLKLWETATGRCLRSFEGHTDWVSAAALSSDGRFALSASYDHTLKVWFLNWDLEAREVADWDEGARAYLTAFLAERSPYAAVLPHRHEPSDEEVTVALTRRGTPTWTEEEFIQFLHTLGCAGYGWLRPEGIRRELERMAARWQGPPPIV